MNSDPSHDSVRAPRSLVIAAFVAIYVFWGSTYLGIRFAIETIPPFLMAGSRFLVAGLLMYIAARWKSHERPTLRQWRDAAIVGCLLLAIGNGSVTYVEQTVPTVITALIISMTPVWIVAIDALRGGPRPGIRIQLGLLFGILGVVSMVLPTSTRSTGAAHFGGVVILLCATFAWSYGSVWSRHAVKPKSPFLLVGMQMVAAGLALLIAGAGSGEIGRFEAGSLSSRSVLAWLYLLIAGSLIGFTAYIWLLQVTTVARVATHSYVNPVIAVILGVGLGGEALSPQAAIGGALVVLAVMLILRAPRTPPRQDAIQPPALPATAARQ